MRFILNVLIFQLFCSANIYAQYISHGPVLGAPSDNSIRIYLRSDSARSFSIELDTDSSFSNPQVFNNNTLTNLDNSVITDINGLSANTQYYYRVKFGNQTDLKKGHFRTFPTEGQPAEFSFVAGSCQETNNMKVYDAMPLHEPLFLLHMGDFTYPSYQLPSSYPADYAMVELGYQRRYEEAVMKETLLPYTPIVYMPDDDDNFGDNRTHKVDVGFTGSSPFANNFFILDTISAIERENVLRGYRNFFPGYPTVDTTEGNYHSFKIANCEFFVLDARSMADPLFQAYELDTASNLWSFNPDSTHSILGNNQMNWLLNGLSNSNAYWKFIVTGVPFNPKIRNLIDVGLVAQGISFDIGGQNGTGFRLSTSFAKYWAGYPSDIDKLVNHVQNNNIDRVLVISGDTHHNVIDDGTNAVFPELNASGISVSTTELAYQINQYAPILGQYPVTDSLWNGGGNGLYNTNFKNGFGKVTVYGQDSVQYCVIDEDNLPLSCIMIYNDGAVNNTTAVELLAAAGGSLKSRMRLFPNPSKDQINIEVDSKTLTEGNYQLQIYNLKGQQLMQQNININSNNLQIFQMSLKNQLNTGNYLIFLINNKGNMMAMEKFQFID